MKETKKTSSLKNRIMVAVAALATIIFLAFALIVLGSMLADSFLEDWSRPETDYVTLIIFGFMYVVLVGACIAFFYYELLPAFKKSVEVNHFLRN